MNTHLKHILKVSVKKKLDSLNFRLLFPGEQNWEYIEKFVVEYFMRLSNGIIHIGAHDGSESQYYDSLNKKVFWIEANPEVFTKLINNIKRFPNQKALNCLVGAKKRTTTLYVTDNEGQSSSALPLSNHGMSAWGLQITKSIEVQSNSLDSIMIEKKIKDHDFLVLDVQGFEMAVLEGAKNSLTQFKFILVECSQVEFYEGSVLYPEIREFLTNFGFHPILRQRGDHFEMLFVNSHQLI